MGKNQCQHCGHISSGFEQEEFVERQCEHDRLKAINIELLAALEAALALTIRPNRHDLWVPAARAAIAKATA